MSARVRGTGTLAAATAVLLGAACADPTASTVGRGELGASASVSADAGTAATNNWEFLALPLLPGGSWTEATAINDSGTIVGFGDVASGRVHAFRYKNGIMRDLGTQPGYPTSRALGINLKGEIVGSATTSARPLVQTAVRWNPTGVIGRLPGVDTVGGSIARGINNSGVVVGSFRVGRADWHASRWMSGRLEDLTPWVTKGLSTEARAVNASGTIVGFGDLHTTFSLYSGAKWDAAKNMTVILPLNNGSNLYADSSRAYDINDSGEWVGWSSYPIAGTADTYISWINYEFYPPVTGVLGAPESAISNKRRHVGTLKLPNGRARAFTSMWFNGGDYGEMLPLPAPYVVSQGVDVNTCGRVVGWVMPVGSHQRRAAVWTRYARGATGRVYPCDP